MKKNESNSFDDDNIINKPKVTSNIIKFCIKKLPDVLLLKLNSVSKNNMDEEEDEENPDKSNIVKSLVKRYLASLSRYLKTADWQIVSLIFKYMHITAQLMMGFKNHIEIYLKIAVRVWSNRHGTNSSNKAMQFIQTILEKKPDNFENCLKLFYINYLEIAKATNWNSLTKIQSMQEDIVNLLSTDLDKAYLTIFSFIRKLCLQLRGTINDKKTTSIKNIYNWQFINSLTLWSKVIARYFKVKKCEIHMLAYPLIQTILGVIRLNLVDFFFPLRIILVNLLNLISQNTNIYIPVSIYLLEVLESSHFKSPFREKHHQARELNEKSANGNQRGHNYNEGKDSSIPDLNVSLKFKKRRFCELWLSFILTRRNY